MKGRRRRRKVERNGSERKVIREGGEGRREGRWSGGKGDGERRKEIRI